jgi:hypothetical protein
MLMTAVFLNIEKAFDMTWHPGLPYKLSELQCLVGLIKLIASFLTNRKFKVSVEDELSLPRKIAAGLPQDSIFCPIILQHIHK